MGSGRYSASDWSKYATKHIDHKGTKEIFSSVKAKNIYLPTADMIRESCDSTDNPASTPIIIGCDVTGSMSPVLDEVIRNEIPTLVKEIYDRKPVTDPHLMLMAIGDAYCDDYPLQVTQFEADIRILEQLKELYLEEGGGGNEHESYLLPLWFAAKHTKIDSYIKRNKKGYLFTMGDESPHRVLHKEEILKTIPDEPIQFDQIGAEDLITLTSKQWNVFHLILEEGSYMRYHGQNCIDEWKELYGQRAIPVSNIKNIAEIITSTIQVIEGEDADKVINSWDKSTALVVQHAIGGLTSPTSNETSLVEF